MRGVFTPEMLQMLNIYQQTSARVSSTLCISYLVPYIFLNLTYRFIHLTLEPWKNLFLSSRLC